VQEGEAGFAMHKLEPWTVVLAAGDGTRLAGLTRLEDGRTAPKQFCSLRGGRSLLGDALRRARRHSSSARTIVVVAEQHRAFWEAELGGVPRENILVQPLNRGTTAGLLLPLLTILQRDHDARVVVLPSDHFVAKERILAEAVGAALSALVEQPASAVLLGVAPDSAETDYGWILPGPADGPLRRVDSFVEKPPAPLARALFDRGGLWNSFLFAARGLTLAALFAEHVPELFEAFELALGGPASRRAAALSELYSERPSSDFSRAVLQHSGERLRVLRVPPCGWTDLGTPTRVAACVRRLPPPRRARGPRCIVDLGQRAWVVA
jgi:mannose-1-phosphate guanylyltransferase